MPVQKEPMVIHNDATLEKLISVVEAPHTRITGGFDEPIACIIVLTEPDRVFLLKTLRGVNQP